VDFVPWVLYYDGNFAIHAVYWHDKFGYRASRGCLGLSLTDAKWLYQWTAEGGYELPYVHVFSSGDYAGE
jgi:lipoprotein-anchoring transpeptidase ErfK/SrfK